MAVIKTEDNCPLKQRNVDILSERPFFSLYFTLALYL
jgi:hypothetical protein